LLALLNQLSIENFRNITVMSLSLDEGVTAFTGDNGAGKTSILDAVHLLGTGKPFSTHRINHVIHRESPSVQVVGRLSAPAKTVLGVRRDRGGGGEARISGAPVKTLSELAKALPLVVMNAETLNVIRDGPEGRRKFIDSFVFHVEQDFAQTSRRYQNALKQRNALLRDRRSADDAVWVRDLSVTGELLSAARSRAVISLAKALEGVLSDVDISLPSWRLLQRPGWGGGLSLHDALAASSDSDRQRGFTQVGPHRGDVVFMVEGSPAHEVLSRGQLRVLMAATKLAQARVMRRDTGVSPLLLVDDVAAELDVNNAAGLFRSMVSDGFQVLATMVDATGASAWTENRLSNVFHVEHGTIIDGN
jgi:DNA replication and repair protein RecF